MTALKLMDGIVSLVCQIEGSFHIYEWKKCHGCLREPSPWRRFFWAPKTSSVKVDGVEGFSNITHADLCDILNLSV